MKHANYSIFLIFLPNVIKTDPYNFELYHFKVGAFLKHSVDLYFNWSLTSCDRPILLFSVAWTSYHLTQLSC